MSVFAKPACGHTCFALKGKSKYYTAVEWFRSYVRKYHLLRFREHRTEEIQWCVLFCHTKPFPDRAGVVSRQLGAGGARC